MRFVKLGLVVLAALAVGCSQSGDGGESDDSADTARHDSEIVPTGEGSLQLLTPYNYVFDLAGTGDPCVAFSNPAAKSHVQVTDLTTEVSINYVSSLSQLQEQLGVDAAIGVKADPIGSGQITTNFTRSFSSSNASYSYLLRVAQSYDVLVSAGLKMVSQPQDPDAFLRACGESFVKGLRYGAVMNILMTIEAPTQTAADKIAAGVTASAGQKVGVANVSGNVSANVNSGKTSTQSQFRVSLTAEAKGFDPRDGQNGALTLPTSADGTIIPETINALSGYLDKLASSVRADRTTDATQDGTNPGRLAIPTNVHRGFYTLTNGFDTAHNPFDTLTPRLDKARAFVSKLNYLQTQLSDVYYDEINAFINADDATKSKFNIAPPGQALPNAQAVTAVVQAEEAIFRPTGGSGVLQGNVTSGVRKLVFDCVESVKTVTGGASNLAACTIDGAAQPEYVAALDALDKYAATSRVLPLHVYNAGDAVFESCDKPSKDIGEPLMLADRTQIEQLAPVVASDTKSCGWYRDTSGACGSLSAGYFTSTTVEAPADIDKGYQCGSDLNLFRQCALLCVPSSGVFGVPTVVGRGKPLPAQ